MRVNSSEVTTKNSDIFYTFATKIKSNSEQIFLYQEFAECQYLIHSAQQDN